MKLEKVIILQFFLLILQVLLIVIEYTQNCKLLSIPVILIGVIELWTSKSLDK